MITYKIVSKHGPTEVFHHDEMVGSIQHQYIGKFRFFPKGSQIGGTSHNTISLCKEEVNNKFKED